MAINGITLFIFGGVSEIEDDPADSRTEFPMAAAGPFASILIGFVMSLPCYWGQSSGWPVEANGVFPYLAWINTLLAAFNLMPQESFALFFGNGKNLRWVTNISSQVGSAFGIIMILLGNIYIPG